MNLAEVETIAHLREWIYATLPGATLDVSGEEITIKTGLGYDMGGLIYDLSEDE
jgi:hypothetical protein